MKKTLLKTLLMTTVFTVNMVWSAAPIDTSVVEHTDAELEALAAPLIMEDRWDAGYVLGHLRQIYPSERETFVRLITDPTIRLIRDDRWDARFVLEELRRISVSEREPLVPLITDPTTRFSADDLSPA